MPPHPANESAVAVAAVAQMVVDLFPFTGPGDLSLRVEPSTDGLPRALAAPDPVDSFVVRLCVGGGDWAKFIYQFGHELGHVLANPYDFTEDRYQWIEEALCETASHYALRAMSRAWRTQPPFDAWEGFPTEFTAYSDRARQDSDRPGRALPRDMTFQDWLSPIRVASLEAAPNTDEGRDAQAVIAAAVLPVFEANPAAWLCLRHLHRFTRRDEPHTRFLKDWYSAAPVVDAQRAVAALTATLT